MRNDIRNTHYSVHERREMNKHSLATYAIDKGNNFESSANEIIKKLMSENDTSFEHHSSWDDLHKNNYDRFMELADQSGLSESELLHQATDPLIDVIYRDEEIMAFVEMKIIYAFKHLEVNIKKLISAAYFGTPVKLFHKWESLETFFTSKSINIKSINGYKEIDQLRIANNFMKHSIDISRLSFENIPEFKNRKSIYYEELNQFYNRIKEFPQKFLESLSLAIYQELYEFDSKKIHMIAESFALRMDHTTALLFCDTLKKYYDHD